MEDCAELLLIRLHHINNTSGEMTIVCNDLATIQVSPLPRVAKGNRNYPPCGVVFGVGKLFVLTKRR
jgi:hypothetical protein